MTCPTCETDLPGTMRFCPSCGSPGSTTADGGPRTQVMASSDSGEIARGRRQTGVLAPPVRDLGSRPDPYPAESGVAGPPTSSTTVLTGASQRDDGPSLGDRVAPAAREAKEQANRVAERFGRLPVDVRIALVGALVTVISFLFFDYSVGLPEPVDVAGRLWLLPIAAVAATALLVGSSRRLRTERRATASAADAEVPRRTDGLLAAVVIATAGTVEAGLFSLLTGDVVGPRAGFYGMLLGLVIVMVACVRAARRTLR